MGAVVELNDHLARSGMTPPEVLVVGTGPAGFFAALGLCERGRRVTMLDAGGAQPDLDASRFFDLSPEGFPAKRANIGLSWQVGGASNLWAGRVAPMEPADLTPENGWPYGYATLEPYFDRAAGIMGLASMAELGAETAALEHVPEWSALIGDADVSVKRFQWSTPPFNTRLALQEAVDRYPGLNVITGARVLRLLSDETGGAVSGVQVAARDGSRVTLEASAYVLAAGGIESPRILLNSGDGGLGNGSGLVGAYFSTHPKMNIGTLELKRPVSVASPMFSDVTRGERSLRFGIGIAPSAGQGRSLNHYVQFSQRFEKIGAYAIEEAQRVFSGKGRMLGSGAIGGAAVAMGKVLFNALGAQRALAQARLSADASRVFRPARRPRPPHHALRGDRPAGHAQGAHPLGPGRGRRGLHPPVCGGSRRAIRAPRHRDGASDPAGRPACLAADQHPFPFPRHPAHGHRSGTFGHRPLRADARNHQSLCLRIVGLPVLRQRQPVPDHRGDGAADGRPDRGSVAPLVGLAPSSGHQQGVAFARGCLEGPFVEPELAVLKVGVEPVIAE
jgi:hypothetical protein